MKFWWHSAGSLEEGIELLHELREKDTAKLLKKQQQAVIISNLRLMESKRLSATFAEGEQKVGPDDSIFSAARSLSYPSARDCRVSPIQGHVTNWRG